MAALHGPALREDKKPFIRIAELDSIGQKCSEDPMTQTKKISAAPSWLGLTENREQFVYLPERAEVVKRIFELAIGGMVMHYGYTPVFTIVGFMHPIAALIIVFFVRSRTKQ